MNGKRMLSIVTALILVIAVLAGTAGSAMAQGLQSGNKGGQPGRLDFTATLHGGVAEKFVLGPSDRNGGYVVDVTPLVVSQDGAYIEKQILPEFNGKMWVDMLTLTTPEYISPLRVHVQAYSTADWAQVFQADISLEPGSWDGYMVQPSAVAAGYVIEINPRGTAEAGDRVEKAVMQPEMPDGSWWDVLRLQIPADQAALQAEVIVYQTPADLPVVMETELVAEPGVWYGMGVGAPLEGGAYIIEVTPLWDEPGQVERYTVQPECDGVNWYDVARVMVTPDWPPMALRITVYQVGGD